MTRLQILLSVAVVCSGESAAHCQPTAAPVTALEFVSGGAELLVGSQAGLSQRSWPELDVQRTLPVKLQQIHDLRLSPNRKLLAVAGGIPAAQGEVVIVNWPDGSTHRRLSGHRDVVYAVAWKHDASNLAAASLDRLCRVFDARSGRQLLKLSGHSRGLSCVTFLPHHNLLLTAGIDHSLRRWNLDSGELEMSAQNHTQPVLDLALRPVPTASAAAGLPMICTSSADRTIRLWQPTIGRMVRFVRLTTTVALAVEWTPDGRWIVASCRDGHLRVIDPDTAEVVQDTPAIDGWAYSLAVHPEGKRVAIGGQSGALRSLKLTVPTNR